MAIANESVDTRRAQIWDATRRYGRVSLRLTLGAFQSVSTPCLDSERKTGRPRFEAFLPRTLTVKEKK
eukprot:1193061-Prorocentrum_minimum.AAC.3